MKHPEYQIYKITVGQIRRRESETLSLVSPPPLKHHISSKLKAKRLFTKENLEDVFQDTIAEFWPKKDRFPDDDPVLPVLIGFSDNIIKRIVRQREKDRMLNLRIKFNNIFRANSYNMKEVEEEEVICQLKDIISDMSPSDAQLLNAYFLLQKNCKEIMNEFAYNSLDSVYTRLSQSKRKLLKKILESPNHELLKEYLKKFGNNGKQ